MNTPLDSVGSFVEQKSHIRVLQYFHLLLGQIVYGGYYCLTSIFLVGCAPFRHTHTHIHGTIIHHKMEQKILDL